MTMESRLLRAHVELAVTPTDEHGMKAAQIARYGAYEVRLVEFSETFPAHTFVFWLELFDHNNKVAVDGGGANDLEEAVTLAEELASQAEELCKKKLRSWQLLHGFRPVVT
jgi:hypothetical protein